MRRLLVAALAAGFLMGFGASAHAQCGGICLYENGSPELGLAAAGAGARAQDASTAFWNPAGLTELSGHEVLIGLVGSFGKLDPDLDASTVTPDPAPIGGGNASGFAPLFGGFLSVELPHGIHVGLASGALYGGSVDYDSNWTGRSFVTDTTLLSFMIQPSIAYAPTEWLSLGVGVPVLYTRYDQRLKATGLPGEPTVKIHKADDWSAGGSFSALVKPFEGTRVGIYYRMEIEANTRGKVEGPAGLNPAIDTDFTFPQGVNVSLFQQVTERWAVLGDVGWTDWSAFGNIPIQINAVGATQQRGWNDTWRIGAGLQYVPSETWTFQGGFGYDSSPVKASKRLPDIPAGEQYRFSAGLQFRPKDYVEISASYQFLWFGDMHIDDVALNPSNSVVLDGKYDPAWASQVGVSLRVKF